MRNKHLQIDGDNQLMATLQKKVKQDLDMQKGTFYLTLAAKLLCFLGGATFFYVLLFQAIAPWLFVLSYVLLGLFLLLFAFNFAHDFSHSTLFKSKGLNHFCFVAIYTLVGAHAEAWKERHIHSHHFAPNVQAYDSDLQITSLIRVSPETPIRWFHSLQHLYAPLSYASYSLYWIFIKDFLLLIKQFHAEGLQWRYLLSFLVQKVVYFSYLLLLPLLLAPQQIGTILLGFLMMHLLQSVFLLFTFFMTHHVMETTYPTTDEKGIIQSSWLMNQIRSSNDMHPFSKLANFILGGFNNHIAHHLFPNIHHIYYPQLSRILYSVLGEHQIVPNQTSYWGGILSHLRLLKQLGVQHK